MATSTYRYPVDPPIPVTKMRRKCHCSPRLYLITICIFQLVSSTERQVFDFLGQMWGPILFNFTSTIVTLIGLFGAIYLRPPHLTLLLLWQLISMTWNAFVMIFYMEIGPFSRESELLNLGTGSRSWWESNGPKCEPKFNESHPDFSFYDMRPISVEGCLIPYHVIETVQAAVHLVLSFLSLIMSCFVLFSSMRHEGQLAVSRVLVNGGPTLSNPYSMSYNPHPTNSIARRGAPHRRSTNSLPDRRSIRRNQTRSRSSTRSTASARRKKRHERRPPNDSNSLYHSQNHLIQNNHYDVSSLDSFNPHTNPIYSGSVHSAGSRFSLYTINPHSTMERINVDTSTNIVGRRRRSPIYMNSSETVM